MRILLAGGGTGGHLFPGIAIAEAFRKRDAGDEICFVGRPQGIEARAVPAAGFDLLTIEVGGLKGEGLRTGLRRVGTAARAILRSVGIIRTARPDLVIGLGAYVSGPVLLAAWLLGVPTAIQEQNALPGLTNRILGRLVDRIFVAFEDRDHRFPAGKTVVTGNPVREIAMDGSGGTSAGSAPFEPPVRRAKGKGANPFRVLVFGGSRGSHGVNRVMLDAVKSMGHRGEQIELVHQTGEDECEAVAREHERISPTTRTVPFIDDMGRAYAWADLVVCRAGALSLAELALQGKAAILVPFPHAADDHQTRNARLLESAGAALVVEEGEGAGVKLAGLLSELLDDPARLASLSERIKQFAAPDAAERIVESCIELVEVKRGTKAQRHRGTKGETDGGE